MAQKKAGTAQLREQGNVVEHGWVMAGTEGGEEGGAVSGDLM